MFANAILSMMTIIHSTDGGVDDFATTALVAAAQECYKEDTHRSFDFPAVIITNADCELISAYLAYVKTARLFGIPTQIGMSSSRVWTQFPWRWRLDSEAVNGIPLLSNRENLPSITFEGDHLFSSVLNQAEKVKIIATGPLTTIADVLRSSPELIQKVSEIHWMGGVIDLPGNIMESPEIPKHLLNDKAEWNVFSDPMAADWIFRNTAIELHLYPLDISEQTIPADFIQILKKKKETIYSNYVAECYHLVEQLPLYRMWDVVAAAGALFPEVFEPPVLEKLQVIISGKEEGAIVREPSGRDVFVYYKFKDNNPQNFYEAAARILAQEK